MIFFGKSNIFAIRKKNKRSIMLIIEVKEGENIDRALKRYKRKFNETGVMKELRSRREFTKPSVKRRNEVLKAKYKESVRKGAE